MSKTVRERILDAAEAKLSELQSEGTATVKANVARPQAAKHLPLVIVVDGDDSADEEAESTGLDIRVTTVEVEGYVRADDAAGIRSAREQLLAEIQQKMLADRNLSDMAIDVTLGDVTVIANEMEGHPYSAAFSQSFLVQYATAEGDPFSLAP